MKIATQQEIDEFMTFAMNDKNIMPYLSLSRWIQKRKAHESDWEGIYTTDERGSFLLHAAFNRNISLSITIELYAKSAIAAGRAIQDFHKIIQMYRPFAIDGCVMESNAKSLKITKRLLGEPWGFEPDGAWNLAKGQMEGVFWFRKLL